MIAMGEWFASWLNVLTHPGEAAFEQERVKPHASLVTAAIWVGLAALISGLFAWIRGVMFARQLEAAGGIQGILGQLDLPPDVTAQLDQLPSGIPVVGSPGIGIGAIVSSVFFAIIFFLIFVGILQLTAKILGGTGNFGMYSYLISTFYAPLTMLGAVVSLIPLVGGCLGLFLWIYELVLAYYATRVEHKLDSGKAIIVVLAPVILAVLFACCGIFAFAGLLGALFGQG
jgi:hypothetical protein